MSAYLSYRIHGRVRHRKYHNDEQSQVVAEQVVAAGAGAVMWFRAPRGRRRKVLETARRYGPLTGVGA